MLKPGLYRRAMLLVTVCLAAQSTGRAAPVTTALTYQGQLKENGVPANGNYDFRFKLSSPGQPVVTPSICAFNVPVVNGLFAVKADFGLPIYEVGLALSLTVDVKSHLPGDPAICLPSPDTFTPLAPAQELTPVPYAVHALHAANGHALDAFDGSPANALFADVTGFVGVGTVSPATELDVRSATSGAAGQIRAGNSVADTWVMLWSGFSNGSNDPAVIWSDDVASDDLRFMTTGVDGTGGAEKMRITGAGNVGIGTTAPARKLHVSAGISGATSATSSDMVLEDDSSAFLHILSPDANESGILFGDPTTSIAGGIVFNASDDLMQFRTGGNNTRMTLDAAGNLGIGTAPLTNLHVLDASGNARIRVESAAGQAAISFLSDSTVENVVYSPNGSDDLRFFVNGADRMTITSAGNIGMGTNAPSERLVVSGNLHVTGATAGDDGVQLPSSAISAAETLEEAGIASDRINGGAAVADATVTLATRTITVPTDGFVLAIAAARVSNNDILLGASNPEMEINKTTAPAATSNTYFEKLEDVTVRSLSLHAVFAVTAGANTFTLTGRSTGNDCTASGIRLTLLFVPTSYGPTDVEVAPSAQYAEIIDTERLESIGSGEGMADRLGLVDYGVDGLRELKEKNAELEVRVERLEALLSSIAAQPDGP